MRRVNLDAEERKETGKGDVGRLRRSGFVPAILYGGSEEPLPVKLDRRKLIHFLHRIGEENVLINLKIKSDEVPFNQLAILKHLEYDPITDQLIHIDFQRVSMKEKIASEVHIILKGEAEGIKSGGILEQVLRTIEVECLPQDMPEHFEIDISNLKVHDSLHVRDIPLPPGVKLLTEEDKAILSILPPRKVEEVVEAVEAEAEVAEPEVEGEEEKKEEEEEKEEKEEK
ncbi:MAG TPA: 50S ribosomal protein L25 [Candidatus Omnitrophica bacterium]|nr:50S ribosomal protein L25 [Candidatus Omnitrophota bacterium]